MNFAVDNMYIYSYQILCYLNVYFQWSHAKIMQEKLKIVSMWNGDRILKLIYLLRDQAEYWISFIREIKK